MRKTLVVAMLFIVLFQTLTVNAAQKNLDAIKAPTYMLVDGTTDSVMLEENCNVSIGVNNFAKIMTAILAIEKLNPDQSVPFTEETHLFFNSYGNLAGAKPGTVFTVRQHLQNMMLLYSDASALTLAVAHSGSEKAFVAEMNKKADEIGLRKTHFSSPDGRADQRANTTPADLYKLFKYAMGLPLFQEVTGTELFELPTESGVDNFSSRNHLISSYTYGFCNYSTAKSAVVAYTEKNASLIAVAEQSGKLIYGLVLNTPDDSTKVYIDMINLFEHGFNDFRSVVLAKKGAFLKQVPVKGALASNAVLVAAKDVAALLPYDYDVELITSEIDAPEELHATVKKDETLGYVTYSYNGNELAKCAIVSEKKIPFSVFSGVYHLFAKINTWLLLVVIVVAFFSFDRYRKKQRKREELRRKKREIMENEE